MQVFLEEDLDFISRNIKLKPKQLKELLVGDYTTTQIAKKKSYIKNRDTYLLKMKEYRTTDNYKKAQKKWRSNNKESESCRHKEWRAKNLEYDLKRRKDYRRKLKVKYNIPDRWGGKAQALVKGVAEDILGCKAISECKFLWLKSDKGYLMPVDMYFPEFNLIIEYNGQQHYFPVDFGCGKEEAKIKYKSQVKRDSLKYKLIKENNYKLLVVPYTLSLTELKKKLFNIREERDKYEQTEYEKFIKKTKLKCRKK